MRRNGATGSMMSKTESTPSTDNPAGDYLTRLRKAAEMKQESRPTAYGPLDVAPQNGEYKIRGVDGHSMKPIPRTNQTVEELVEVFDQRLEENLEGL